MCILLCVDMYTFKQLSMISACRSSICWVIHLYNKRPHTLKWRKNITSTPKLIRNKNNGNSMEAHVDHPCRFVLSENKSVLNWNNCQKILIDRKMSLTDAEL